MSAIWGVIGELGKDKLKSIESEMKQGYEKCIIDSWNSYVNQSVAMGCGIQYFVPEAKFEAMPIVIENEEIYFVADAIIDNRQDMLKILGKDYDKHSVSDGQILFEVFHKFKEDSLNKLLGAYAFVYHDKKKQETYLVMDATGRRSLHFCIYEDCLYFSTLIKPLIKVTGAKKLNEEWIADYLGADGLSNAIKYDWTPYEGVERCEAAHYIKFSKKEKKKVKYWCPSVKELKLSSDEEYKKMFLDTYIEANRCLLRNDVVAMLLSGGLDSTSVACIVAKELNGTDKKLISFTSIPEKGYETSDIGNNVSNEFGTVLKTKKFLENRGYSIECETVDAQGKNAWDDRYRLSESLEIPMKSKQNIIWIQNALRKSYENDSRILLMAGYGNITISNTMTGVYQTSLVRRFHWLKFLRECRISKRKYNLSWKKAISISGNIFIDAWRKNIPRMNEPISEKSMISSELLNSTACRDRIERYNIDAYKLAFDDVAARKVLFNELVFYQTGETQTRNSLETGVINRDPTIDKRLIELCMSFPVGQFGKEGVRRRLVREYLKDIMPPEVINSKGFGVQSADLVNRILDQKQRIIDEMLTTLQNNKDTKYVDINKLQNQINEIKDNDNLQAFDLLRVIYTLDLLEYIERERHDGYIK